MPENRLRPKPYVIRFYLGSILAFVFVKGLLRPLVLERDMWVGLDVFVLSFPNVVEAIVGVTVIYGLLLFARHRGLTWVRSRSDGFLLSASALLTVVYVLTQEFGLHHLGGNNVTDPYDAAASLVGIVGTSILYFTRGVIRVTEQAEGIHA